MHGPPHKLAALAVCLWLIAAPGCAQTTKGNWNWPWVKKPTNDYLSQVKTPDDRIKELKELAKKAHKLPAAEQQTAVAALCKELQNESEPILRRNILRTLAEFPQPEAATAIIGTLEDNDLETRRTACRCLGKRGGPDAVRELTRVISSDTVHDVRVAAVRAGPHQRQDGAWRPWPRHWPTPTRPCKPLPRNPWQTSAATTSATTSKPGASTRPRARARRRKSAWPSASNAPSTNRRGAVPIPTAQLARCRQGE